MSWAELAPYPGTENKIVIGCPQAEYHLAQQLPGCNYDKERGIWKVPLSWAAYVCIRQIWSATPIEFGPVLQAWAWEAYARIEISYARRAALDATAGSPDAQLALHEIEKLSELHLFPPQAGGAVWLADEQRACLNDPQGLGKTPQAIRALQILAHNTTPESPAWPFPALVIATASALVNWQREFARWAPELDVHIIAGTALKRRKLLLDGKPADVFVMSWANMRNHSRLAAYPSVAFKRCVACGGGDDAVKPASCQVHRKELNELGLRTVIADEAHRMQDAKSAQTRAVWWLMQSARYAWPVTGTPIGDTIENFWPVGRALDPASFPSKTRYLDLFAIKQYNFRGGATVLDLRPDTAPAFHSVVQPMIRRVPKEVAAPWLPPRMPEVFRYPEMGAAQARIYRQLEKSALALVDREEAPGSLLVPPNTISVFTRMCQASSATLEIHDSEDPQGFTGQSVRMALPASKVDDLLDFLADNPEQLVVSANTPQLIKLAEKKFIEYKITYQAITGGNPDPYRRDAAVEAFQRGDSRVILVSIRAGGESITLTASNTVYFMQPNPSFLARSQMIGRVERIGSEKHQGIRIVNSITPGTVEERLYLLGTEKEERANNLTRDKDLIRWMIKGEDQDGTAA